MKITYTQEQIQTIITNLNQIATQGIQSARAIAIIAQTLDSGEKQKEGEDNSTEHT